MRTDGTEHPTPNARLAVTAGELVTWIAAISALVLSHVAFGETLLEERANDVLGLTNSRVVTLDVDHTPGVTQDVALPLDGTSVLLRLVPHSVRSDMYEVRVQVGDGSYVAAKPGPVRTVRGELLGMPGSVVAGSVLPDGLTAMIDLPDGRQFWVESIASRVAGAAAGDHVVYDSSAVIPNGGSCATQVKNMAVFTEADPPLPEGSGCDFFPCVTELACDADVEFFNAWGSVEGVEARINLITNTMNIQYERDVDITHAITTIIVRTAEPDPYSSSSAQTLLNQFRIHWLNQQQSVVRDLAELFTGKELFGGTIGIAFDIGAICTNNAFCLVQSDFNGSFSCAVDLSAHEIGHLWRGFHCNCPAHTMNPVITCANQFNPSATIPSIVFHRNTRSCLDNSQSPPPTAFPFFANFVTTDLNPPKWINEGAEVTDLGNAPPSPPLSLTFNITDRIATGSMDATESCDLTLEYWWQRTGNGGSPEPGEDLIVEYRASDGGWEEIAVHPGAGADDLPFQQNSILLPPGAHHSALQVRWRLINGESSDNFFIDDIHIGCPVDATPEILHSSGLPGETRPFSGYVDPRSESDDGVTVNRGIDTTRIRFNQPVFQCDGSPLTGALAAFEITETGAAASPTITGVTYVDGDESYVEVSWDRPITLQEWTTIRAVDVCSAKGFPIASLGDLGPNSDEPDRVDLGFLPADVDQSSVVNPLDLLKFKQLVNGIVTPDNGTDEDFVDINRSGGVNPLDLLDFKRLINGVSPPSTRVWAGESMNHTRP